MTGTGRTSAAGAGIAVALAIAACGGRTENAATSSPGSAGTSGSAGAAGTSGTGGSAGTRAPDAGRDAADAASDDSSADAGHDHHVADAGPMDAGCLTGFPDAEARIAAKHRQALASLLEGYASGAITVYSGTATGRDNRSVIGDGVPDGELSGAVVASLVRSEEMVLDGLSGPVHLLRIASPAQAKALRVGQLAAGPGVGHLTPVEDLHTSGGVSGRTDTVLPAFGPRPDVLAFRAHGEGQWAIPRPLVVDLEVSLTRVPPASLAFADLEPLDHNLGLGQFTIAGTEHVRQIEGVLVETGCPPAGSGFVMGECTYRIAYRVTEFVETVDLTSHGVRDIVVDSQEFCCFHCDQPMHHGCAGGVRSKCF